jgi:hypothetical protein
MSKSSTAEDRVGYLQMIDTLLEAPCILYSEIVLAAVDHENFVGLSRLLEKSNGVLDFEKNAIFSDGPKASQLIFP